MMPSQKSVKNCHCTQCINVGGPNGHNWDSSPYRGHWTHVCAESASASETIAEASKEFITTFTDGWVTSLPSSTDNATTTPSTQLSKSTSHKFLSHLCKMPMPPLVDVLDDDDDEPLIVSKVSPHSEHKKTHNKIPHHDWTILKNVQGKIHDCTDWLSLSPDSLKETKSTIEECCVAVNKIALKHLDIVSLQSMVITL